MLMKVEEVAEKLQVSKQQVYKLIRSKKIPVHRLSSRCIRIDGDKLLEWIATR